MPVTGKVEVTPPVTPASRAALDSAVAVPVKPAVVVTAAVAAPASRAASD